MHITHRAMVLDSYVKKGNIFVNPLDAIIGNKLNKTDYLDDVLPNITWIAILFKKEGLEKTRKILDNLFKVIDEINNHSNINGFLCNFRLLSSENWNKIKENLDSDVLDTLRSDLAIIVYLYPRCPLIHLYEQEWLDSHPIDKEPTLKEIIKIFDELNYKLSFLSTISIGLLITSQIKRGRLVIRKEHLANFDLDYLINNWDSEEAKKIRPSFRATIQMLIDNTEKVRSYWANYFWKRGFEISDCNIIFEIYKKEIEKNKQNFEKNEDYSKKIAEIISSIAELLDSIYSNLFKNYTYDSKELYRDEVLLGLFNRQFKLLKNIILDIGLWKEEIGRILLRSALDSYFLLIYFKTKATVDEVGKYIDYGLGKEKLLIEHLKQNAKTDSHKKFFEKIAKEFDESLERDINTMFLNVNIGDWKDFSYRDLAIKIDKKGMYDYIYTPLSEVIHGGWASIRKHSLRPCYNPLHKRHKIPNTSQMRYDTLIVYFALKLMIELLIFGNDQLNLDINAGSIKKIKESYENLYQIILR